MKWFLFIPVFIVAASAENRCTNDGYTSTVCSSPDLRADELIDASPSTKILRLYQAAGTIGTQTLSSLPEVTTLILHGIGIKGIEAGSLCGLPKLEHLGLIGPSFPVLTSSFLNNCRNLKTLDILEIQVEPSAFSSMTNLELLKIQKVSISHLTKEHFEQLKNLKHFESYDSEIAKIDPNVLCIPPKMEEILMVQAILPHLNGESFGNCNNLKKLTISFLFDHDRHIEDDTFHNLVNLKYLDASGPDMKQLTKTYFIGLTQLETLDLHTPDVVAIDSDTFSDLVSLETLTLRTGLEEIPSDVFKNLAKLKKLRLRFHRLKSIDSLEHSQLTELYIEGRAIETIDANAVKSNLPKLEKLTIEYSAMNCTYGNRLLQELQNKGIDAIFTRRIDKNC